MADFDWRGASLTALKYGVGLAALAWVVTSVDWATTLDVLAGLSPAALGAVLAISVVGLFVRAATWYALTLHFADGDLVSVLRADLVIKFVNSLFPSRVSGRSIAPLALRHYVDLEWNESVAVTVAHTGLYAVLYGVVTLVGYGVDAGRYGAGLGAVILLSTAAYLAVGGGVVLAGWRFDLFDGLLDRLGSIVAPLPGGARVESALDGVRSTLLEGTDRQFQGLLRDPRAVGLFVTTWVFTLMVVPALRFWVLFEATGSTGLNPLLLPLYVVVAYSVTVLPLTPGGVGVAEATAVAVFVALGVPAAAVVPVVFLDRIFGIYLPSLAGWVPLMRTDLRGTAPE